MQARCLRCRHYYTTFDPNAPRGCRKFGLKASQMPSYLVRQETGEECLGYELRPSKLKDKEDETLDLNRDDLW